MKRKVQQKKELLSVKPLFDDEILLQVFNRTSNIVEKHKIKDTTNILEYCVTNKIDTKDYLKNKNYDIDRYIDNMSEKDILKEYNEIMKLFNYSYKNKQAYKIPSFQKYLKSNEINIFVYMLLVFKISEIDNIKNNYIEYNFKLRYASDYFTKKQYIKLVFNKYKFLKLKYFDNELYKLNNKIINNLNKIIVKMMYKNIV